MKPWCCWQCWVDKAPLGATQPQMFVCLVCGNKRCPKATDHGLICSNSNDSGQIGSRYGLSVLKKEVKM